MGKLAFRDLRLQRLGAMRGDSASLSLNFLAGVMDPRITFTRATTATYFNADGLLRVAAVGVPRFDYDPVTLQPKGLLIEGPRTNLLLQSENVSAAVWSRADISIDADSALAPNGESSADKLVENTGASAEHQSSQPVNVTSGTTYTYSQYLKASGRTSISLGLRVAALWAGGANQIVEFHLEGSGTATVTSGTPSYSITAVGNGWYLCTITSTAEATGSAIARVQWITAGDGVSGVYVWGAQLEAGAFPTSYIPTTTTSLTRAKDFAEMTGANFSNWFNPEAGALVFESVIDGYSSVANDSVITITGDNAATDSMKVFIAGAGPHYRAEIRAGGVGSFLQNVTAPSDIFKIVRCGMTWDATSAYSCSNLDIGNPTDSSIVIPSVNKLRIDVTNDAMHIRRLQYYRTRLPDSELQRLTS